MKACFLFGWLKFSKNLYDIILDEYFLYVEICKQSKWIYKKFDLLSFANSVFFRNITERVQLTPKNKV